MRNNAASNSICSSAYSIAIKIKKKRQWKQMGIAQPKHLGFLFNHRSILRSRKDSNHAITVMYPAFFTPHRNGRCNPVLCCRSAGHFVLPLRCRMRAALALSWTLLWFSFLCSFGQATLTVNRTGVFFVLQGRKIGLIPLRSKRARY